MWEIAHFLCKSDLLCKAYLCRQWAVQTRLTDARPEVGAYGRYKAWSECLTTVSQSKADRRNYSPCGRRSSASNSATRAAAAIRSARSSLARSAGRYPRAESLALCVRRERG